MMHRQKRVLIALGWYDYRLHRGIEKYALEHNWHLTASMARERVIRWGWNGTGILAWLGAADDLADFVTQAGKPTVDFSFRRPHLPFARVLEDQQQAGALVAEHFLSRGFTQFVFYSDSDNWSYVERGQGFESALKRNNHACIWWRWHRASAYRKDQDQWPRKCKWLVAQLKPASKPLAVFAATDDHAVDILECCESFGISDPEHVAIVGAENNLLAPDAMRTPISSVDTNLEMLGYCGAALLDELMKGRKPPKLPLRIPPAGLVTRKSSDLLAVNHKGVANSLRFMSEHAHESIKVSDLVSAAMMSRRGLHNAFIANIGRSPGQELQRIRIERAKRMLANSNYKVDALARMCGYQSANTFCVAFKHATGLSPKQFQESVIPPVDSPKPMSK